MKIRARRHRSGNVTWQLDLGLVEGRRVQRSYGTEKEAKAALRAAQEAQAAAVGAQILRQGGNAVDAAVAGALTMAVTLPSRAGLGGGGACVALDAQRGLARSIVFPAGARADVPPGAKEVEVRQPSP